MNDYPYPVLLPEGSSYKDTSYFCLEVEKVNSNDTEIDFAYKIELESEYLECLLKDNTAKIIVKMQSNYSNKIIVIGQSNERSGVFSVPSDKLEEFDEVIFTAYIIANRNFEFQNNGELLEIYGANYKLNFKKYNVLAVTNKVRHEFSSSKNFIVFHKDDRVVGCGYKIYLGSDSVSVLVSSKFLVGYEGVKKEVTINKIFSAHIYFEIFVYILCVVAQYRDYDDTDWYKTLKVIYEYREKGNKFDKVLEEIRNGIPIDEEKEKPEINMEKVFSYAHLLTNYKVEKNICNFSKNGV